MSYAILLLVLIVLVIIYQKTELKNKYALSNLCIRNLKFIELFMSSACIFSFLIIIGNRENGRGEQSILNSIRLDTINLAYYEKVPFKKYNEGLYTREELDTLENDTKNLSNWINTNHVSVYNSINSLEKILIDFSCVPSKLSSIENLDWDYYYENYKYYIDLYNEHINEYKKFQREREVLEKMVIYNEYIIPLTIILSLVLGIFITICEYNNKQHTKK